MLPSCILYRPEEMRRFINMCDLWVAFMNREIGEIQEMKPGFASDPPALFCGYCCAAPRTRRARMANSASAAQNVAHGCSGTVGYAVQNTAIEWRYPSVPPLLLSRSLRRGYNAIIFNQVKGYAHRDVSTTMTCTHVLNRRPGAVRSPADQLMLPKTGDIGLTGSRSIIGREPEARKDEKPIRFNNKLK